METEKVLIKTVQALENLNIPYLVTGGIAVAAWGRVRSTLDIDIVIEIKEGQIHQLVKVIGELSENGYISEEMAKDALRREGEFNFIDPTTGLKVDFWIKKKGDKLSQEEFNRRIFKDIQGQKIYFISPEDLILEKLNWYKLTESSRHLEDAESVLKISKVDLNYIKQWAERQSTMEILEKILNKKLDI